MKTLLLLASLAFAPAAQAQLDRLLAPVTAATSADLPAIAALQPAHTAALIPARQHLTTERLLAKLERELGTRFAVAGELKLSLARTWEPVKLPADDLFLSVTELPIGGVSGAFFVRIKASSGGTMLGEWQLPLRAQLWQEVWIAATRLERGQPLDRTMLGAQKVDVLRERNPLILATADPATFEVAQSVPAGRPLTTRDLIARPLIRKGQLVEVVARQGLLAVTMKALALESGAAGDLIKLRNVESRREFSGQILHESKVQVQF